jgi:hypothetical protein
MTFNETRDPPRLVERVEILSLEIFHQCNLAWITGHQNRCGGWSAECAERVKPPLARHKKITAIAPLYKNGLEQPMPNN